MSNEVAIVSPAKDFSPAPNLSKQEIKMVLAKQENRISQEDDTDILKSVNNFVSITLFETKFKFEEGELIPIVTTIAQDIKTDFPYLTLKEVELAFRNGVRGVYGDFQGLSVRTYYLWITKYDQERRRALKIQQDHDRALQLAKQSEIPAETIEKRMAGYIYLEYQSYLTCGRINKVIAWDQYEWLRKNGIIQKPEGKLREKIIEQAKERVKQEFSPMVASNKKERYEFASIIETIFQKNETENKYLLRQCACIMLERTYEKLKKQNKDLKELLTNHFNNK